MGLWYGFKWNIRPGIKTSAWRIKWCSNASSLPPLPVEQGFSFQHIERNGFISRWLKKTHQEHRLTTIKPWSVYGMCQAQCIDIWGHTLSSGLAVAVSCLCIVAPVLQLVLIRQNNLCYLTCMMFVWRQNTGGVHRAPPNLRSRKELHRRRWRGSAEQLVAGTVVG